MIPIYKPFLPKESKKYALEALDEGWLTTHKYNIEVEELLCQILGTKNVLLVSNGTMAAHLVAKGLKYRFPLIKNIIAPNIVYVAAWNSFLFDKDFDIFQVETCLKTWNFDIEQVKKIASNMDNAAILAVHNIGNPISIKDLKTTNCPVVEDACEALFGKHETGKSVSTEGLVSSLSFFGNKTITSGEGGAVVTDDNDLADYLKDLRGQGQTKQNYIHDKLGYNYRMTNIQAAILRGQLDYINEILEKKNIIWERYINAFKNNENIELQFVNDNNIHSKWMFAIRFPKTKYDFNKKREFFNSRGVDIRPMFYPMNYHSHLVSNHKVHFCNDINGEEISRTTIMIPSYPELTIKDQEIVISTVHEFCNIEN